MKILEFENKHFGVEDFKEAAFNMGHTVKVVSTELILLRESSEFDSLFEKETGNDTYDFVFTFNYSVVVSANCQKHNIKYIS